MSSETVNSGLGRGNGLADGVVLLITLGTTVLLAAPVIASSRFIHYIKQHNGAYALFATFVIVWAAFMIASMPWEMSRALRGDSWMGVVVSAVVALRNAILLIWIIYMVLF